MTNEYSYNNNYYPTTEIDRQTTPTQNGQWFYLPQHYFKHRDH